MAAEITPARITELVRDAQIAFCLDKYPSFEVALVRKVEAALATQQATQGAEPDGWLYVMHMEGGQKNKAFSDDRYDFPTHSPFGRRGRDYSEEYEVTEHPIHLTAPPPTAEVEKDAAQQKKWAMCTETETPCSVCPTAGTPCAAAATPATTVTDQQIATLKSRFGITSSGRGIKEFTQVRDFALAVAALQSDQAQAGKGE